jgi:hypothetical protein
MPNQITALHILTLLSDLSSTTKNLLFSLGELRNLFKNLYYSATLHLCAKLYLVAIFEVIFQEEFKF